MLKLPTNKLANLLGLRQSTPAPQSSASGATAVTPNAYRRVSAKGLSLAVKPEVLGDVPVIDPSKPTFYVIREYSRSNSLLLGMMTDELGLPSALAHITERGLDESSAMVFLKGRDKERDLSVSPRLERLVQALSLIHI